MSFQEADSRAKALVQKLTMEQKIEMIGGHDRFYIKGYPELGIPWIYMTDATAGVRLLPQFPLADWLEPVDVTTRFPAPICLSSTWNPDLAFEFAKSVGEECRAVGAGILLGPGMNIYRQSQCGRNFEYFGEDPALTSSMIAQYVRGMQSTGTMATLKHFMANNTEFFRRRSNTVIDERTMHEIYLPAFKAGIEAGALAVMTSYNQINGEWCSQSAYVIDQVLKGDLGFQWLVMTDWEAVYDGVKTATSGQDLEMPLRFALADIKGLLESGRVAVGHIDRMVTGIIRSCIACGLYDRKAQDLSYLQKFAEHEKTSLEIDRQGIVLLKNGGGLLPLGGNIKKIVVAGKYAHEIPAGGGAAEVKGYSHVSMLDALKAEFPGMVEVAGLGDETAIRGADAVILSTGTFDSEGWDRPFELPEAEEAALKKALSWNPSSVVVVNSGSGIRMTGWAGDAAALLYAWYPGQSGMKALAEILSGKTNPSGKLPISIEKDFADSPGAAYIPEGEKLYHNWPADEHGHPVYDVVYAEGVFVGYRWYDAKSIEPLFPFGHGLSYTTFEIGSLMLSSPALKTGDALSVSFTVKNTGKAAGAETVQLYVRDVESSHPRPVKELKAYKKVFLSPGEETHVKLTLDASAFSYWNPDTKEWTIEKGRFQILAGKSSREIVRTADMTVHG
jgi:beta-glucosidase